MTEQDVAGLLASRREAVTDLAAMRDRLRQEVRCRSAAVAQLKEAREQRDADRIALVRAKEAHAGVALERDRLKRQVAAHSGGAVRGVDAAVAGRRAAAGRFPASSPVVNRRSAAASSDSSLARAVAAAAHARQGGARTTSRAAPVHRRRGGDAQIFSRGSCSYSDDLFCSLGTETAIARRVCLEYRAPADITVARRVRRATSLGSEWATPAEL